MSPLPADFSVPRDKVTPINLRAATVQELLREPDPPPTSWRPLLAYLVVLIASMAVFVAAIIGSAQ